MEKEEAGDDERLVATNPAPVAAVRASAVPVAAPIQYPSKAEHLVQHREEESSDEKYSCTSPRVLGVSQHKQGRQFSQVHRHGKRKSSREPGRR
jgi:hypothetical protein